MQQRRLAYVAAAAASLVGAVLVPTPSALAASHVVTQPSPITGSHEAGGQAGAFETADFDIGDGARVVLSLSGAPEGAVVTSVYAAVGVEHPHLDDVDLVLVAPGGRAMTLASDVGGAASGERYLVFDHTAPPYQDDDIGDGLVSGAPVDYDIAGDVDTYPGSPPASFGALAGGVVNGDWTLLVDDDTGENSGKVVHWMLTVSYGLPASPSASELVVSGLPSTVSDVNLELLDVNGYLGNTELLLESPDGRYAHVLSDAGRSDPRTPVVHADLVLNDEAGVDIPALVAPYTGVYRPRNYDLPEQSEPVGGVETIDMDAKLSAFDGGQANGTWKLWVFQEACCATVEIGSWALGIRATDPSPPPPPPPLPTPALPSPAAPSPATPSLPSPTSPAHDLTAPKVVTTTPRHNAKGVRPQAALKVTFSEAMSPPSLSARTIRLATAAGHRVGATLTWKAARKQLVVKPKRPLARHTAYLLTVKRGVHDLAGNRLAMTKRAAFTTH